MQNEDRLYREPELWGYRKMQSTGTLGKAVRVIDGNTLEAIYLAKGPKSEKRLLRLAGVDAPGSGETFGELARQALEDAMMTGHQHQGFLLDEFEVDPDWKSTTGVVYVETGEPERDGDDWGYKSVNYQLVRMGLGRASARYGTFAGMYHAEDAARAEGLGIWAGEQANTGVEQNDGVEENDGVLEENAYGVPESLPMTAVLLLLGFMAWMYHTDAWRMWTVMRFALADTLLLGDVVSLGVAWALLGLAASIVVPGAYLAVFTTLSKYAVNTPGWLAAVQRPVYVLGAVGATTAVALGVFFAALCLADPFSETISDDFLPTLRVYMERMARGAIVTYRSDYHHHFDISKPWVIYFAVASYCGVIAAFSPRRWLQARGGSGAHLGASGGD